MHTTYLNRVLIYLQQELPEDYREHICIINEKLIIIIPDSVNFHQAYDTLHQAVIASIGRIRSRDIDLEFTIKSKNQERDFKILK